MFQKRLLFGFSSGKSGQSNKPTDLFQDWHWLWKGGGLMTASVIHILFLSSRCTSFEKSDHQGWPLPRLRLVSSPTPPRVGQNTIIITTHGAPLDTGQDINKPVSHLSFCQGPSSRINCLNKIYQQKYRYQLTHSKLSDVSGVSLNHRIISPSDPRYWHRITSLHLSSPAPLSSNVLVTRTRAARTPETFSETRLT